MAYLPRSWEGWLLQHHFQFVWPPRKLPTVLGLSSGCPTITAKRKSNGPGWKNGARDNTQLFAMEFMVDIFPVPQLLLQVGSSLNDPPMYSQRKDQHAVQQISPIVDPSLRLEGIECPAPSPKLRFTYRGLDGLDGRNSGQHVTVTASSVQRWRCLETAVPTFLPGCLRAELWNVDCIVWSFDFSIVFATRRRPTFMFGPRSIQTYPDFSAWKK